MRFLIRLKIRFLSAYITFLTIICSEAPSPDSPPCDKRKKRFLSRLAKARELCRKIYGYEGSHISEDEAVNFKLLEASAYLQESFAFDGEERMLRNTSAFLIARTIIQRNYSTLDENQKKACDKAYLEAGANTVDYNPKIRGQLADHILARFSDMNYGKIFGEPNFLNFKISIAEDIQLFRQLVSLTYGYDNSFIFKNMLNRCSHYSEVFDSFSGWQKNFHKNANGFLLSVHLSVAAAFLEKIRWNNNNEFKTYLGTINDVRDVIVSAGSVLSEESDNSLDYSFYYNLANSALSLALLNWEENGGYLELASICFGKTVACSDEHALQKLLYKQALSRAAAGDYYDSMNLLRDAFSPNWTPFNKLRLVSGRREFSHWYDRALNLYLFACMSVDEYEVAFGLRFSLAQYIHKIGEQILTIENGRNLTANKIEKVFKNFHPDGAVTSSTTNSDVFHEFLNNGIGSFIDSNAENNPNDSDHDNVPSKTDQLDRYDILINICLTEIGVGCLSAAKNTTNLSEPIIMGFVKDTTNVVSPINDILHKQNDVLSRYQALAMTLIETGGIGDLATLTSFNEAIKRFFSLKLHSDIAKLISSDMFERGREMPTNVGIIANPLLGLFSTAIQERVGNQFRVVSARDRYSNIDFVQEISPQKTILIVVTFDVEMPIVEKFAQNWREIGEVIILSGQNATKLAVMDALPHVSAAIFVAHGYLETHLNDSNRIQLFNESLSLEDLQSLELRASPTVILGCCDSNNGYADPISYSGNNFPRQFLNRGAGQVICTNWPVYWPLIAGLLSSLSKINICNASDVRNQLHSYQQKLKHGTFDLKKHYLPGALSTLSTIEGGFDPFDLDNDGSKYLELVDFICDGSKPYNWAAFSTYY